MTSPIPQGLFEARMGTQKLQSFVSWSPLVPAFPTHSYQYTGTSHSAHHLLGPHLASTLSVDTARNSLGLQIHLAVSLPLAAW